jgi:hypothetical protein
MHPPFQMRHLLAALTLLAAATAHTSTLAATLTFPTAACSTTLQACVNAAAPGDTVEIATNLPISEDLIIDKSLTLRPALGFSPVLNDNASVILLNTAGKSNTIAFEGITLNHGYVEAVQLSTQPFDVKVRNISVTDTFNDRSAVEVRTGLSGLYGPVTFDIADNDIRIPDAYQTITAISVQGLSASTFTGSIRNNTIQHLAGGQGGGIMVYNNISQLEVDVIGNRVTGSNYNTGIQFFQTGAGDANVRIINNLVDGQLSHSGQPGSVAIGTTGGHASFEILNNTLVNSDVGLSVGGRKDLGGTWDGTIANNIVAYASDWGMVIENPFGSITNEYNLLYDTWSDHYSPGPGFLYTDPQFAGPNDFRLLPTSPAINAGHNPHVAADILTDLNGIARIQGPRVEMGAFEHAVPEPTTLTLLLPLVFLSLRRRPTND